MNKREQFHICCVLGTKLLQVIVNIEKFKRESRRIRETAPRPFCERQTRMTVSSHFCVSLEYTMDFITRLWGFRRHCLYATACVFLSDGYWGLGGPFIHYINMRRARPLQPQRFQSIFMGQCRNTPRSIKEPLRLLWMPYRSKYHRLICGKEIASPHSLGNTCGSDGCLEIVQMQFVFGLVFKCRV